MEKKHSGKHTHASAETPEERAGTRRMKRAKRTARKKKALIAALAGAGALITAAAVLLIVLMTPAPQPVLEPSPPPVPTVREQATPAPTVSPSASPSPSKKAMLPEMKKLYEQNSDIAGWIKIADTKIDYPVMYTPGDAQFYLYRTFEKEDDPTRQGCLFIDYHCAIEPRSTNLLIHGHNMKNGTMFHTLIDYKEEAFYKEHPVIEYTTLYEKQEYEIVCAFLSKVYNVDDDVFKFYKFYDAKNKAEFDAFIENCRALALYDTGVEAEYGDELITLTTCEYSTENGRMVVLARRKTE